jgi:hypothetical protein
MLCLLTLLPLLYYLLYYHLNRNKYNVLPVGGLTLVKNNEYRDENGILWRKRGFFNSLLHNPFKYYVFETYDIKKISSSEVKILKTDFGFKPTFQTSSFNYYSSYRFPVKHFFADVLPVFLFLNLNLNLLFGVRV